MRRKTTLMLGSLLLLGANACNSQGESSENSDGLSDGSDDGIDLDADGGGEKLDVGGADGGQTPGTGTCTPSGETTFSFIWIANSEQGTVSKIDTKTGVERGRYWAGPAEGQSDPSRTSVNLAGDVVVSIRDPGGITKISALESGCIDRNNNGTIETSTGPNDILAWDTDECVLWHRVIPSSEQYNGPRPTAWDARAISTPDNECVLSAARVWVGYKHDNDHGVFWRLDGQTGVILDEVEGPEYENRPYGGAVDAQGNFWVTGWQFDHAIRIDGQTLEITDFGNPGIEFYGMTLDARGGLWVADRSDTGAVAHLDPTTEQWSVIPQAGGKTRGIQIDRQGQAWLAGNNPCRLVQVDTDSETVVNDAIELPGCGTPVGISIDPDGFVWVVDQDADQAYKVNPNSHDIALIVEGLVGPYTYSDMTGAGLALVSYPPAG